MAGTLDQHVDDVFLDESDGDEDQFDSRYDPRSSRIHYSTHDQIRSWSESNKTSISRPSMYKSEGLHGHIGKATFHDDNDKDRDWSCIGGSQPLFHLTTQAMGVDASRLLETRQVARYNDWKRLLVGPNQDRPFPQTGDEIKPSQELSPRSFHEEQSQSEPTSKGVDQLQLRIKHEVKEPTRSSTSDGYVPNFDHHHSTLLPDANTISNVGQTAPVHPGCLFAIQSLRAVLQDRRAVVVEIVHRAIALELLRRHFIVVKHHHPDRVQLSPPRERQPHRVEPNESKSSVIIQRRRPTAQPLIGVEAAWETELLETLQLDHAFEQPYVDFSKATSSHIKKQAARTLEDSSSTFSCNGSSAHNSTQSSPSKRRRCNQTSSDDQGKNRSFSDSESDDTPPKRSRPTKPAAVAKRLLACPYWKYDPRRFSESNRREKHYRGCSSVYLTDIARLKQHLHRVHMMPEHHCQRCLQVFDHAGELDEHARAAVACTPRDERYSERFSDAQYRQLKKRWTGKSVEESWNCIWSILFPYLETPTSPYADELLPPVDPGRLPQFISDFQQRAPSLLRDILLERIPEALPEAVSTWLRSRGAQALLTESLHDLLGRLGHSTEFESSSPVSADLASIESLPDLPNLDGDVLQWNIYDQFLEEPGYKDGSTGSEGGEVLNEKGPHLQRSRNIRSIDTIDPQLILLKPTSGQENTVTYREGGAFGILQHESPPAFEFIPSGIPSLENGVSRSWIPR